MGKMRRTEIRKGDYARFVGRPKIFRVRDVGVRDGVRFVDLEAAPWLGPNGSKRSHWPVVSTRLQRVEPEMVKTLTDRHDPQRLLKP